MKLLLLAIPILAGAAVLATGSGVGEVRLDGRPPQEVVAATSPEISVRFSGWPAGLRMEVDGRALEPEISWFRGRAVAKARDLEDGEHRLRVADREWTFRVDTVAPEATVEAPSAVASASVTLQGRTEPGARVEAGGVAGRAGADGGFALEVPLREGPNAVDWSASDAAGNRTAGTVEVLCDPSPPEVALRVDEVVKTASPILAILAEDPQTGVESLRLRVDGGKWLRPAGKEHQFERLYEGRRKVEVEAVNGLGAVTRLEREFVVDSTERFGEGILTLGARGKDVEELQKRLRAEGLLDEPEVVGSFGEPTRAAVLAFQEATGLEADGVAGPYTTGALSTRIYVNLARFSLVLVEPGGKLRSWPIAHGTEEFPTPTGDFFVWDLARNPTWIPPDSVWAREAKVTPPGPGNPLGTRWIGLNSGVVGIHGTPAEWTIGSRASHGCIRMTVADVEDLFERVQPGTRVTIFAGTEKDPLLQRYWP